jgi:hypothetical protein
MERPRDLISLLSSMLSHGLLLIRAAGSQGRSDLCALEADHLHNLPTLMASSSPRELVHYWDVERPAYIDHAPESHRASWMPFWAALEPHVVQLRSCLGEVVAASR